MCTLINTKIKYINLRVLNLNRLLTLHEAGGTLKAPPEEKLRFWCIFKIQLIKKKFDFSQISMTMPPIHFWGLKIAYKWVSIAF